VEALALEAGIPNRRGTTARELLTVSVASHIIRSYVAPEIRWRGSVTRERCPTARVLQISVVQAVPRTACFESPRSTPWQPELQKNLRLGTGASVALVIALFFPQSVLAQVTYAYQSSIASGWATFPQPLGNCVLPPCGTPTAFSFTTPYGTVTQQTRYSTGSAYFFLWSTGTNQLVLCLTSSFTKTLDLA
jgi:hypothetical protein